MSEICGWCKHYEDSHRKSDMACPNIHIGGYLMSTFKTCRHPRYERINAKHEACVVCGTRQALTQHPVTE